MIKRRRGEKMIRKIKKLDDIREPDFFGSIFDSLTGFLEQVENMSEKGQLEEIPFSTQEGKKGEIRYGYNVRFLGGRPVGPGLPRLRRKSMAPLVKVPAEEKEPLIDIFDRKNEIIIVADVPGFEKKDIELEVKGKELVILARAKDRKYHKKVQLPAQVQKKIKRLSYRSGVLEICLKKKGR